MTGSLGVVMLVHTDFARAAQVALHWARSGCPVVIHIDRMVGEAEASQLRQAVSQSELISFSSRFRCEWGMWGLVAATQAASEKLMETNPGLQHVFLASGACLPLRPVSELVEYLSNHPTTDFIESATIEDVVWTMGGLDSERFTMRFPFSWRRQRALFDRYVSVQRALRIKRRIPLNITPHMGSQWWCLTRTTLSAMLNDPDRARFDRYFRKTWIPDESYFQTLARRHSTNIQSRSLTLSKFDFQGKPHVFYDDHLQLLRRSDCFVARKVWPRADKLYDAFLTDEAGALKRTEPNPGKIDRVFSQGIVRRTKGRPGLYMQSRYPGAQRYQGITAAPYSVFQGFDELFIGFHTWLAQKTSAQVHGHLFDKAQVRFSDGQSHFSGALSNRAKIRDYDPEAFLTSLIWNAREHRQCFQFGPESQQRIAEWLAKDTHAQVSVITGVWAISLSRSDADMQVIRRQAARLQQIEGKFFQTLKQGHMRSNIRIWSLAEFLEAPRENLEAIIEEITPGSAGTWKDLPQMVDLTGFGDFLQSLKNQGMHPYLAGDLALTQSFQASSAKR